GACTVEGKALVKPVHPIGFTCRRPASADEQAKATVLSQDQIADPAVQPPPAFSMGQPIFRSTPSYMSISNSPTFACVSATGLLPAVGSITARAAISPKRCGSTPI